MTPRPEIVFLFNLLQDVNIQRGLVQLAAQETGAGLRFLVSEAFLKRDRLQIWQKELTALAAETGAELHVFGTMAEVHAILQGRGGMIFAASESNLDAHWQTRDTFRVAPPSFLKVTLQHGLECVGFLQSREHVIGHGRNISFNADVVCAWQNRDRLSALTVAGRGKVYVTGPPTLLGQARPHPDHPPQSGGIVCENMHSVRLSASGNHRASFMDIFFEFCSDLDQRDRQVTLRPHPGGQYVLKNNVALPENVQLNNLPIYQVNLPGYAYGISAPSTIVLDMVLAGIPVGVWRDSGGVMDAGNYDGLTEISGLEDWRAFERDAMLRPQMLLDRQKGFLDGLGMVQDPAEISRRFARLMVNGLEAMAGPVTADTTAGAAGGRANSAVTADTTLGAVTADTTLGAVTADTTNGAVTADTTNGATPPLRILFLADEDAPGLRADFLDPLAPLLQQGRIETCRLSPDAFASLSTQEPAPETGVGPWMAGHIAGAAADVLLCTGYSGAYADLIIAAAAEQGLPILLHGDAGFLQNLRRKSGKRKVAARTMLAAADLIFAATPALKRALQGQARGTPIIASQVIGGRRLLRPALPGPVRRLGLIHPEAQDLHVMAPQLAGYLSRTPGAGLDILGAPALPDALRRLRAQVRLLPDDDAPAEPTEALAATALDSAWDIALVPDRGGLPADVFETQWRYLSACGVAMLSPRRDRSKNERWQNVAANGWENALQDLTDHPEKRHQIALQAQARMLMRHSDARLRDEIMAVLTQLRATARTAPDALTRPARAIVTPDGLIQTQEDPS